VPTADIYSPEPNILERRVADYLAAHGADTDGGVPPSQTSMGQITRVTRWAVGLSALAGLISGGLIGGAEIWMRNTVLDGMNGADWQNALPYWSAFYVFVGVISAVEITLLYALALKGITRVAQLSGLQLSRGAAPRLFSHSLARVALEFPSPKVEIYGIDPYAHVSAWKLLALNIAYKLKVGVSSFILRVFLRRVAARMAIRGMVPLFAGPLYAVWNAFIMWRILAEARVRTLGPFAVDRLIEAHFHDAGELPVTERNVILQAAGEMLTLGRDAHPNQIYLMTRLRNALDHHEDITLDWGAVRAHLSTLEATSQTRVLDLLTLSCVIGARTHREQTEFLRNASDDCRATLDEKRLKDLRKALTRGDQITPAALSGTRSHTVAQTA